MARQRPRALVITDPKFEPYALAIGQMNLAWNELHEVLGNQFVRTFSPADYIQLAAVWGAITSDRQKRIVLETAIRYMDKTEHIHALKMSADVRWVMERANSLEDKRNNVVHAPLGEVSNILAAVLSKQEMGAVCPGGIFNERASKLGKATTRAGKDLLTEIILYRDYAETLAAYAGELLTAWTVPDEAWPERPALPPLKDQG